MKKHNRSSSVPSAPRWAPPVCCRGVGLQARTPPHEQCALLRGCPRLPGTLLLSRAVPRRSGCASAMRTRGLPRPARLWGRVAGLAAAGPGRVQVEGRGRGAGSRSHLAWAGRKACSDDKSLVSDVVCISRHFYKEHAAPAYLTQFNWGGGTPRCLLLVKQDHRPAF